MLSILDPEDFEQKLVRLYARLKRKRIEPCEVCEGTGRLAITTDWVGDEETVPITRSKYCECKRRALFDLDLYEAGLTREFWRADEIVPESNEDHYALLARYAKSVNGVVLEEGLSILMTGENGVGKTSSAAVAMIGAIRGNVKAALVSWPDYVNVARQGRFDTKLNKRLSKRLGRTLLVIDEIGKESKLNAKDEFALQQLDSIIRKRRGDKLPTILITNLSVAKFFEDYGESIKSLISSPYQILQYEPGDFRSRMKDSWSTLEGGD